MRSLLLVREKELDIRIFIRYSGLHFIHDRPWNGRPTDIAHSIVVHVWRSEGICLHRRLLLLILVQQRNILHKALPVVSLHLIEFPRFHHLIGRDAGFAAQSIGVGVTADAEQNVEVGLEDLRELHVDVLRMTEFRGEGPVFRGGFRVPW